MFIIKPMIIIWVLDNSMANSTGFTNNYFSKNIASNENTRNLVHQYSCNSSYHKNHSCSHSAMWNLNKQQFAI